MTGGSRDDVENNSRPPTVVSGKYAICFNVYSSSPNTCSSQRNCENRVHGGQGLSFVL